MGFVGTSTRQSKRELVIPSKNSYVYKLGFRYAIVWRGKNNNIEKDLSKIFGPPAKSYHYYTYGSTPRVKSCFAQAETYRWYYGSKKWNSPKHFNEYWAVFKTDKDRTLSLLTI